MNTLLVKIKTKVRVRKASNSSTKRRQVGGRRADSLLPAPSQPQPGSAPPGGTAGPGRGSLLATFLPVPASCTSCLCTPELIPGADSRAFRFPRGVLKRHEKAASESTLHGEKGIWIPEPPGFPTLPSSSRPGEDMELGPLNFRPKSKPSSCSA